MSVALTETVESLHIAAAQKLMELLQTEKDPSLLAKLIATALRFKLPRPSTRNSTNPPQPAGASSPPAPHNGDDTPHYTDTDDGPPCLIPVPYTDEQYLALIKQHGHMEAASMRQRRYNIIAALTRERRSLAPQSTG